MAKKTTNTKARTTKKPAKPREKPKATTPLVEALRSKYAPEIIVKLVEQENLEKKELAEQAFFKAMRQMQNELPDLPKTKEAVDGKGRRYKYCPLPLMKEIIQPYLYKYEFIYRWDFKLVDNNQIECTIILKHSAGHSETASMTADRDDSEGLSNLQSVGSLRTYLQRYTFIAVLGLAMAEEDNDGASDTSSKASSAIPGPTAVSDERRAYELMDLNELMLRINVARVEKLLDEKFNGKREGFTEFEKNMIKGEIINMLLEKK